MRIQARPVPTPEKISGSQRRAAVEEKLRARLVEILDEERRAQIAEYLGVPLHRINDCLAPTKIQYALPASWFVLLSEILGHSVLDCLETPERLRHLELGRLAEKQWELLKKK